MIKKTDILKTIQTDKEQGADTEPTGPLIGLATEDDPTPADAETSAGFHQYLRGMTST